MESIPKEVIQYNLFMLLSDKDLSQLCLIDNYFKSLCNDNNFWKMRIKKVFSKRILDSKAIKNIYGGDYKKLYKDLRKVDNIRIKFFPHYDLYAFYLIKNLKWTYTNHQIPKDILLLPQLNELTTDHRLNEEEIHILDNLKKR